MGLIRKITIHILLFAAFSLVVINVIPHHHHSHELCFVSDHCSDDTHEAPDYSPDHKSEEQGHHHHNNNADFCHLNYLYFLPFGKNVTNIYKPGFVKKYLNDHTFQKIEGQFDLPPSTRLHKEIFRGDKPYIPTKSLTRALRAPPVS